MDIRRCHSDLSIVASAGFLFMVNKMIVKGLSMQKRSIRIAGHNTSISLESEFWGALKCIAEVRKLSLNQLVAEVDKGRVGNLSSALRVYVLRSLQGN